MANRSHFTLHTHVRKNIYCTHVTGRTFEKYFAELAEGTKGQEFGEWRICNKIETTNCLTRVDG